MIREVHISLGASVLLAGSLLLHAGQGGPHRSDPKAVVGASDVVVEADDGAEPPEGLEAKLLKGTLHLVLAVKTDFPAGQLRELASVIADESAMAGVDPFLVISVIKHESRFDPDALSPRGAIGLMQVMPQNFKNIGCNVRDECSPDMFDPKTNVRSGIRYLGILRKRFKDPLLYVAAYRTGPERVKRYLAGELDADGAEDLLGYARLVMRDYAWFKREYRKYTDADAVARLSALIH